MYTSPGMQNLHAFPDSLGKVTVNQAIVSINKTFHRLHGDVEKSFIFYYTRQNKNKNHDLTVSSTLQKGACGDADGI